MTGRLHRLVRISKKVGLKNKVILDVGSSYGWFCGIAIDEGAKEVWGIDPNKEQLKKAKKEVPKAKFKLSDASKLPFGNNKFDIVTLFDVVEHIPKNSEPKTLKEIYRVLKPGGSLIISTPNDNLLAKLTDPAWYFGHRHYSKERLTMLLKDSQFKMESANTYGGYWEIIAMAVLYASKWILRMEMPFEEWFDKKRRKEFNQKGFTHLMTVSKKPTH